MADVMRCRAQSDGVCRGLYCPRHRQKLAYCPWARNGYTNVPAGSVEPILDLEWAERRKKTSKRNKGFRGTTYGSASEARSVKAMDLPDGWKPGDKLPEVPAMKSRADTELTEVKFDAGCVGQWLSCPRCSEGMLRSKAVTVYDREPDDEMVARTVVQSGLVSSTVMPSSDENPSRRRHGIVISFSCETCDFEKPAPTIELVVLQHKGMTQIGWRHAPRTLSSAERDLPDGPTGRSRTERGC